MINNNLHSLIEGECYTLRKKIAKWFDSVGKWVSEKWDTIKEFPGKIWTAIVDTVKGWIGLTPQGKMPVTVAEDKPKKGWLTSLTDFLLPQWLVDFAKDAVGTVVSWLGLKKKAIVATATSFSKKVFGTIKKVGDILGDIAKNVIGEKITADIGIRCC